MITVHNADELSRALADGHTHAVLRGAVRLRLGANTTVLGDGAECAIATFARIGGLFYWEE